MRTLTRIGKENEKCFAPFLQGVPVQEEVFRLGLLEEGKPVGAVAAMIEEDRADLLQLYVVPSARKKGNGRFLMKSFLSAAEKGGLTGVCAVYPVNPGMDRIFETEGFLVLPGDSLLMIRKQDAASSPQAKRWKKEKMPESLKLRSVASLTPKERNEMYAFLEEEELSRADLGAVSAEEELSAVILKEDQVEAVLIAGKQRDFYLVEFLASRSKGDAASVMRLLSHVTERASEDPVCKWLGFYAGDPHVRAFAEKLAGDPSLIQEDRITGFASAVLGGE